MSVQLSIILFQFTAPDKVKLRARNRSYSGLEVGGKSQTHSLRSYIYLLNTQLETLSYGVVS